jgi:hypothetical protein
MIYLNGTEVHDVRRRARNNKNPVQLGYQWSAAYNLGACDREEEMPRINCAKGVAYRKQLGIVPFTPARE